MHKNINLEDIISELKEENHTRFDDLYKATKNQIYYTIIAILKDKSLAEDAMQDTYLKILRNISSYKPKTNPMAWMVMIARNTALNIYNKRKRETLISPDEMTILAQEDEMKPTPLLDLMYQVLKPRERELIIMHIINGMTHKQIARLLKRPLGTVLWQYNRAIKKLRAKAGELNV